jgi:hypothetical protein
MAHTRLNHSFILLLAGGFHKKVVLAVETHTREEGPQPGERKREEFVSNKSGGTVL